MSDTVTGTEAAQLASQVSQSSERPSWLPEGMNSGEELAARYAELERQHSGNRAAADDQSPTSPAYSADVPANANEAQELVDGAGLDFAAYSTEYTQNGTLSAKSYAELARAGMGRDMVDGFIAGQHALASEIKQQVFDTAGGADAYADMVAWASTGFTVAEIDAFNANMNSGDRYQMRLAVDGLKARYTAENGTKPNLIGGTSGYSQSAGDVFTSTKQMTDAMRDPRYSTNAAYRQSVIEKVGRSNIL